MSTSIRSTLSASIGPGLSVITACSAYFNGALALTTTISFGLAVAWSIIEVVLRSYTPIDSIELDGPSLLANDTTSSTAAACDAGNVVAFSDPNPWRERAA